MEGGEGMLVLIMVVMMGRVIGSQAIAETRGIRCGGFGVVGQGIVGR